MANIVHPLLTLLASLTRQELAQQIRYLKAENEILRSKLPGRVTLDNRERNTLVKHGKKLGGKIKDVMTIVSYSTFRRWVRKMEDDTRAPAKKSAKRGTGRPKIEEDVRETILRIRKETGFGYTKILQELRRMGVHVSRQTVKNAIVDAGFAPTPGDHPDTWHKFLKRHADTLWQCDFACKKKWTLKGLVDVYFMVFIHLGTRQIWISPCTENPTGEWTTQQGRNFQMHIDDNELKCEILMRDRDRKYVDSFDDVFKTSDCKVKLTPIRSPNLQAHVERVVQTIKHEVLNAFCIVTNEHLDGILHTTQSWYNQRRGHSSRDHLPPIRDDVVTVPIKFSKDSVVCDSELGGHLLSYRHVA
ncbi:integrase core domain-containing protein [Aporhodopirellula aestuarii]|uniref:Integrase core domain-containing protein n=1 Tax=Aporhodopirellula aestuarii TaxID=2950107 RepID=A0ABT0UCQ2_9BACT|nr:integrase core domain-containing protein [Aporhodopirellula aestuarii]MCM2374673.1 integrase core domain-containing protein [Aporhodopirellula aestuarii]